MTSEILMDKLLVTGNITRHKTSSSLYPFSTSVAIDKGPSQEKAILMERVSTEIVVVFVGVTHHPLHGGVIVLHPRAPLGSGRGRGSTQEDPKAPPVAPAAAGTASDGRHS